MLRHPNQVKSKPPTTGPAAIATPPAAVQIPIARARRRQSWAQASLRIASELGTSKIRVNAISAGPIKTISARGIKDFSKVLEFVQQHAPLRRNTDPAEVADTAVFLASDLGRGVTGNIIYVDSGFQIMGL